MSSATDSAKFNAQSEYYAPVGSSGPGGVTSIGGATGVITLNPSSSVAATVAGQNISFSTAGLAQAPLSVTTAGTVSAGQFTGAGFGLFLPTTPAGTGSTGVALGSTGQFLNIVIGNTRIQGGTKTVIANSGGGVITFATPFIGIPLVYAITATDQNTWVVTQSTTGATLGLPAVGPSDIISYLAIGPA